MTYETPQQFGILRLSENEYFKDATVTFYFGRTDKTDACINVIKLDYIPEDQEFESATLLDILQALITHNSKSSAMTKIAEMNGFKSIDDQSTSIIPISDLSGPAIYIFITSDIKASIHGVIGVREWDNLEDSSNIYNIDDVDLEENALLAQVINDDI